MKSEVIVFSCFRQIYKPSIIQKQNFILDEKFVF